MRKRPPSESEQTRRVPLHPAVEERLARLAPDQRAAATAPAGPVLCVAPAGSGKTTTLVARVAWLVATGVSPAEIAAVTFNRRAAEELQERTDVALAPLGVGPGLLRVRTFHALGREILRDGGRTVEPLVDREDVLRKLLGTDLTPARLRLLDDGISRLKLDLGVDAAALGAEVAAAERVGRPAGLVVRTYLRYEAALASCGGLDFDDLVRRALLALESDGGLLARWRDRCLHLLVDEVQDVDRSQLRLALLLASPANRIFLVGDDDQTIYAWRLADVRRVLGLAGDLPGLRRVDLVTNYRCPAPVVQRAVRLVECNRERFAKTIRHRPHATGTLYLAPDPGDDVARARRLLRTWPPEREGTRAILARTNAELAPYAAACIEAGIPYRAADDGLVIDDPDVDAVLDRIAGSAGRGSHLRILGAMRSSELEPRRRELLSAMLGWGAAFADGTALRAAVATTRARRADLRRDDASLTLATAHGTKGLEFDHVAVVGLDEGRFPSARSVSEADDPVRVMEEERRLAYVAWTRARRTLALLYDPGAPSQFLREAFEPDELGMPGRLSG